MAGAITTSRAGIANTERVSSLADVAGFAWLQAERAMLMRGL